MSKITYADKEYIYENAEIPAINKITDDDMNEIKTVVNANDDRLTTAETDINNAEAVIGNETDTYSASSTYALGSLVIYNSLLYKCTTAITVAEAWNGAKWTQVNLTSLAQSRNAYSTEEQIIGKWIDGKPIYRKTIVVTNDSTLTEINLQHNIQNLNEVTDVRGSIKTYTSWKPITHIYVPDVPQYGVAIYNIDPTGFMILVGTKLASEKNFTKAYVTLEYTKTTD